MRLVIQATPRAKDYEALAQRHALVLNFEAFADRRYLDDGSLMPRQQAGAVMSKPAMLEQAALLIDKQCVKTITGRQLNLTADTLCVHGDNEQALDAVIAIRAMVGHR